MDIFFLTIETFETFETFETKETATTPCGMVAESVWEEYQLCHVTDTTWCCQSCHYRAQSSENGIDNHAPRVLVLFSHRDN